MTEVKGVLPQADPHHDMYHNSGDK
jgi:hypothetical protein